MPDADDNWGAALDTLIDDVLKAEAEAYGLKQSADEISAQKRAADKRAEEAREKIRDMLVENGIAGEERPRATLSVTPGRKSLLAGPDADPEALPIDLVRIRKDADKKAITAAINAGVKVAGFSVVTGDPTLTIKLKEQANG